MVEFLEEPHETDEQVRPRARLTRDNPMLKWCKKSGETRSHPEGQPDLWVGKTITFAVLEDERKQVMNDIRQAARALGWGYTSSYEMIDDTSVRIKFAVKYLDARPGSRSGKKKPSPANMPRRPSR